MINDVLKKPPTFLDTLDKLAKEKEQRDNLFKVAPTPALQRIEQTKKDLRAGKKATPNNVPQKTTIRTKYGVFEVEVPKSSLRQVAFSNVENRNKYVLTPELYAEIRKEIEDAQEKAGVAKTRPDLPDIEVNPPEVDITAETLKNLKAWEDKYIRSTAVGRSYQDTLKWVQNEAEQYSNRADSPVAKLAGALVSGMAEDAANPLATFESAVGNMYDPNATFEERFGAIGNAALYGLSVAPFVKAGSAGVRAIKATQMAEQAIARGLKIKAGLVAFGRTYGRETLLGGFAERRVTISQLRKTLEEKGFTAKEIDDVINSQRKLYKIWSKTNKGDFNDFLLQAVRNETKSAEKAGENVADAIGTGADVTDAVDNVDTPRMDAQPAKAPDVQEPDIPGYNVPEEQLQNIPSAQGVANFENLWRMAKESGTLNDKQIYVGKTLWMARAKAWAKENNRNEMDFFENLIVTKDDVKPDSALMQSITKSPEFDRALKKLTEEGVSILEADRLGIHDYVTGSGDIIPQRGGFQFTRDVQRNVGIDAEGNPIQGVWAGQKLPDNVSKMLTPNRAIVALSDYNLLNAPDTAMRWFDEIDAKAKTSNNPKYKQEIFEILKKSQENIGTSNNIKYIADFKNIDELKEYLRADSTGFESRGAFWKALFGPKRDGYGGVLSNTRMAQLPPGLDIPTAQDIINKAIDPGYASHNIFDVGAFIELTGKKGSAEDFGITPTKNYKEIAEGSPLAVGVNVPGFSMKEMFSTDFQKWKDRKWQKVQNYLDAAPLRKQEFLDELAKASDGTRKDKVRNKFDMDEREESFERKTASLDNFMRDTKRASLPDNPLSVLTPDKDKLAQYLEEIERVNGTLFQKDMDGIAKGWYNEANRQINFMTGLSDFSTFVHESFHDWATTLKKEHVDVLANVFGDMTTVEGKEAAARAFERYLRDGVAPTTELERVFVSIKGWMKAVYNKLKGSPIEAKVDPRARRVFDEMLGSTAYGDEGVTSARKAFTDADRKAMGLKATKEIDPESFQQWLDDSDQMVTDSGMSLNGWGNATADRILANPTALSDVETAGMSSICKTLRTSTLHSMQNSLQQLTKRRSRLLVNRSSGLRNSLTTQRLRLSCLVQKRVVRSTHRR